MLFDSRQIGTVRSTYNDITVLRLRDLHDELSQVCDRIKKYNSLSQDVRDALSEVLVECSEKVRKVASFLNSEVEDLEEIYDEI